MSEKKYFISKDTFTINATALGFGISPTFQIPIGDGPSEREGTYIYVHYIDVIVTCNILANTAVRYYFSFPESGLISPETAL